MAKSDNQLHWCPTPTTLISGSMVLAGFFLTGVSWWFFLLAALGTFGPGILRELGLLRDKDEFQRGADHRAGYHAFITVGLVAFFLVAYFRSGDRQVKDPNGMATFFLALLWFVWFFSSLTAFWGPQKTAARVLYAFGSVWLIFAILSNLGSEWTGWAALLLHPLLAMPFFVLAWLSKRWPRVAGGLLLIAFFLFGHLFGWGNSNLGQFTQAVTYVLFLGPLVSSGIALIFAGENRDATEEDDELPVPEC